MVMMKTFFQVILVLSMILIAVSLAFPARTTAGSIQYVSSAWSKPAQLNSAEQFSPSVFAVADSSGLIHVAWSANTIEPKLRDADLDTIFYTRIRGTEVSPERDIFVAEEGGEVRISRLRIDQQESLHLLYMESPGIVYAWAPAIEADDARAWTSHRISEHTKYSDFAIGADGSINLVYVINNEGIYFIRSIDQGESWSMPITIEKLNSQISSGSVRIEIGADGVMHLAFAINTADLEWRPKGIAYARSTDGGLSWQKTLEVLERDNFPNIGFDAQGEVHLVYDNPAGTMVGRGHAWSRDGGVTWARVERILPGYSGQTLWPVMSLDNGGSFYLVSAANPPAEGEPRILLSEWQSNEWQFPQVISAEMIGTEAPSMAVSLGNELHVVWISYDPDQFGAWHTTAQTDAPAISPQALSAPPTAENGETGIAPSLENADSSTSTPDPLLVKSENKKLISTNPTLPVFYGVLTTIIVLGGLIVIKMYKKR